jgi:tetratricopeptide (TPR) repeat protein
MNSNQIMQQGITMVNTGDLNGGMQLINHAISIDPNDPEKLHARGQIHSALKKTIEAIADYQKAIQLNSRVYQYHYNLGNVYFDSRQFQEAVDTYTKALELNPNDSDIYSNRGMCLIQVSKRKEAYNDFKKALQMNPHDQPAKNGMNILLSVDPSLANQ